MKVEFKTLDKDNLPEKEVIAFNLMPRTFGYKESNQGFLSLDLDDIICESEHCQLSGCTHYIDINDIDIDSLKF